MNKEIHMAAECMLFEELSPDKFEAALMKFAELVRADDREKAKWDVHSCGPTCTNAACVAVREAVKAERLACAQLIENMWGQDADANDFAQAIRSRGQK